MKWIKILFTKHEIWIVRRARKLPFFAMLFSVSLYAWNLVPALLTTLLMVLFHNEFSFIASFFNVWLIIVIIINVLLLIPYFAIILPCMWDWYCISYGLGRGDWKPILNKELELKKRLNKLEGREFIQLNEDWNAEPNACCLRLEKDENGLKAFMAPDSFLNPEYEKIDEICIHFENCSKYRVTPINDHAFFGGQCRFSFLAPKYEEFYEITGDTKDKKEPTSWINADGNGVRHFHFYLRDETLEVKAENWAKTNC